MPDPQPDAPPDPSAAPVTGDWATEELVPVLAPLVEPVLTELAARLAKLAGLGEGEQTAVYEGVAIVLRREVWRRVSRVLVVELNTARLTGRLTAATAEERWSEWLAEATAPGWWESLDNRYPTLRDRLRRLTTNRCMAAAQAAERFVADRAAVAGLGVADPELVGFGPGAGDSHEGGETVTTLELADGKVLYKPRSLRIDEELGTLLRRLLPDEPDETRIRTPAVVRRGGYGWCGFEQHRYCANDTELATFYRGIGHWLAVMRLLNASDLHSENLVAVGPVPVVVDCETMFTPHAPLPESGFGHALDRAVDLVSGSVLRTGLLPFRGVALAMRGADLSATGGLPGQQPEVEIPTIVGAGTDEAKLGFVTMPTALAANHPSPNPVLELHWGVVEEGMEELTARLVRLDRAGELEPMLAPFRECRVRVVVRDTVVYMELGRMLWHPVSLHREPRAVQRAVDNLLRNGQTRPLAPTAPAVIDTEVADLLVGDVPVFAGPAGNAPPELTGDAAGADREGTDLVARALARWRSVDPAVDRVITRSAMLSAYLNEGDIETEAAGPERPVPGALAVSPESTGDPALLDKRRRDAAAEAIRRLAAGTIRGDDGTVSWIAPSLSITGVHVLPLPLDLYNGTSGVAVAAAAYQAEVLAGRADPVPDAEWLLVDTLRTLRLGDDVAARDRADAPTGNRPEAPGGYVGLASQVVGWLLLCRLGVVGSEEAAQRAGRLATHLPAVATGHEAGDLIAGTAGAIVPLLRLAELTGGERWRAAAVELGDLVVTQASQHADRTAWWTGQLKPQGLGGLAHGSTGVGWALDRLATATGEARFAELAAAAFRFEETLYRPDLGGWRDLRKPAGVSPWWCHGAAGIGIAAADLARRHPESDRWREWLQAAAVLCWDSGLGTTHTLCHGDLGTWELVAEALAAEVGPAGVDRTLLDATVVDSIATHGPRCQARLEVFVPGLMTGYGGVAYQLLRMHPACPLPSLLLPDPGIPQPGNSRRPA